MICRCVCVCATKQFHVVLCLDQARAGACAVAAGASTPFPDRQVSVVAIDPTMVDCANGLITMVQTIGLALDVRILVGGCSSTTMLQIRAHRTHPLVWLFVFRNKLTFISHFQTFSFKITYGIIE